MGRKISINVCIVIGTVSVAITIILTLIIYGLSGKYTGDIKTSYLKKLINSSLPVVRYTYDSGKAEYSIVSDMKETIYDFTGIDTSEPVRMISGSSSLHKLYIQKYWISSLNPVDPDDQQGSIISPSTAPSVTDPGTISPTPGPSAAESGDNSQASTPTPTPSQNPSGSGTIGAGGKSTYGKVSIRNGSNLVIDINKIMKTSFIPKFDRKSDDPQILIYHTHTTECYIKDLSELNNNNYDSWSTDNSKTVVRVGHELDTVLSKVYGFNVIHNSTVHNQNYNESYNKSSITVRSVLKGNPSIKLSIDIHRDGLALGTGKLRVVQNVKGVDCAQIMFVVGTNENSENPRWEDNLRLAMTLAAKLEEIAPGITRYVSVRSSRYNEHIAENGLLVEFGGDGNTVSEVTASAKYLAQAIDEVMK